MTVTMTDGINIDAQAIHDRYPNNPVAYYANGEWAWSPQQVHMFSQHIAITVTGNLPESMAYARVIDVENGDATPADVRPYLAEHARLGFSNGTVYSDISTLPAVISAAGDFDVPRYWVAWYWSRPGAPTQQQVLQAIAQQTGINLPPVKLWACQYANYAQWDLSAVYGKPDFSR